MVAGGWKAHALALDVSDESSVVAACAQVVADHGAPWLLVNNAGLQDRQLLLDATASEWDRINAVNARGPLASTGPEFEGPAMRQAPFGLVEAREIGVAVLFFALPTGRAITNQALALDAGFSIT